MTLTANDRVTLVPLRPRYEGANIRTWVGFKHLLYLVEEAVLAWFRERGAGPQRLYHDYELGLEIISSSTLLLALVEVDDEVTAEVTLKQPGLFAVKLLVKRGVPTVALTSKVRVALVREKNASAVGSVPEEFAPLVVTDMAQAATDVERRDRRIAAGKEPRAVLLTGGSPACLWSWKARYFHCHYSARVQHSSYVRALEEVVDRFLEERGISVGRVLREEGLIPVVSRVRVELLADAHMGETVHTSFVVGEVLKGVAYDGRMDSHVQRGETMVHMASARILHGYAVSRGEGAGQLAQLSESTLAALTGEAEL
jgi:acyl-CoA thioesterase FadM